MITGDHFIALGGKLAANPSADEATCRTAVSRAYHGAFHVAKTFVTSLGIRVGHSHGEIQHVLLESGHPRAREAGEYLFNLQTIRVKADYDLSSPAAETIPSARRSVELASNLRSVLGELDNDTERSLVKAGVEAYLRKIGQFRSTTT